MLATPATLQRTYSIRENVCKKLRICCAPHLVLSRPVGREIRFLKLERLPAEGDCTFLQHYCLHTLHSLAWDQPSPATATNHNCTLAKVARCWHLLPAPQHPCTPLHFPPPLYKSSPAPLGAPAPSNRKPATVRTSVQAAAGGPGGPRRQFFVLPSCFQEPDAEYLPCLGRTTIRSSSEDCQAALAALL